MTDTSFGANELDRFRATFFEECAELIADMESRLSGLHSETADAEELNAIFRAVHSIKAGAGAFGLKPLVKFSHTFEALLDWLRDGRIHQDDRVSAVLVRAGDVLAALVDAAQTSIDIGDGFGLDVAEDLNSLLNEARGEIGEPASVPPAAPVPPAAAPKGSADRMSCYKISFRPHTELFRHANEPLLLIREMQRIGRLTTRCDLSALPPLSSIDPEDSYLSWTFELETTHPRSTVVEIFEFVDEDCFLDITDQAFSDAGTEGFGLFGEQNFGLFEDDASPNSAAQGSDASAQAGAAPPAATPTPAAPTPARTPEPAARTAGPSRPATATSIRVDLARIDRLVNMVGELVITQAMLAQQIIDQSGGLGQQSIQGHEDLAMLTRELQECVMAIRMQPVKSVFQRMPRLVREVSGKLDKRVNLVMSGELTEVDKTVIEELADPLTHMIRNSIDHGIETPAIRTSRGKPEEGTILLSAAHVGSNILIQISDDGAGINRERLLQKAIEKGIVAASASLSDEEIDELIFAPGFSTAAQVTDVSGRGVGMDVVRRNINALGGRIQVQSTLGKGTKFTLIIPLTLAVLDGMVVAVGAEKYILPLTSIIESFRPDPRNLRTLNGGGEVASIRGEYVRLIYLCKIFDVAEAVTDPSRGLVVLVETASGGKIGIVVDELIGQQQVVIKSLQENFDPVAGISGATILGNGRVALILDIEELASLSERRRRSGRDGSERPASSPPAHPPAPDADPVIVREAAGRRMAGGSR